MKNITLFTVLLSLIFVGGVAFAQEVELSDPGMTPDSPFYFLERVSEAVGTFFTFGDLKKAERHALLANERLAEAKAVMEKGKSELVEKTLQRYENQLNNSTDRAEKAMFEGKDFEKVMGAIAKAGKTTAVHLEVLTEVYEKVPEQAKSAIENAMKASVKRHEKAVEALKSSNHLAEVPEGAPISMKIPQEARERIQRKVQEELMIEKEKEQIKRTIEEVIQGSESPRDFCLRVGLPLETCEKLPTEDFKSFEQIEAYCVETGGPPDYCTSLKTKCKELGVTKAGDCFRVISNATLNAFQSAELKAVPARALSEEEMKQQRIQTGPATERVVNEAGKEAQYYYKDQIEMGQFEPLEISTEAVEKRLKQRYVPGVSKVIVYSAPVCPHCISVTQWLEENNIEYEEIDISQNEIKQNELKERIGKIVVPIIEVEDDIIVGFNKEALSELFGVK